MPPSICFLQKYFTTKTDVTSNPTSFTLQLNMPRTSRNLTYKQRYRIKYGIAVYSRKTAGKINEAKCNFCTTFGRDAVKSGRVSNSIGTRKDDIVFKSKFCTDSLLQNYKLMHFMN